MTRRGTTLCILALVALTACPAKKNESDSDTTAKPIKTTEKTSSPTPSSTGSTTVKVEEPTPPPSKAGVEDHVKAELDGRADGITGSPVAAAGAKAALQSPTGWKGAPKGDVNVVAAGDDKARIAATGFTGDPTAKLAAVATAAGLTNCEWNAPQSIVSGKDKLAATAADGACTKGTAPVHAAYVAPTAEGLLVVGAWDAGGDMAGVFGSMRSIAKAAGGGDSTGIAACCSALRGNAKSAPPQQAGAYLLAAGACDAIKNNPQGRAALGTVRSMLAGASVPSTCK